ncbi:MAG: hypothetical protein KDC46_13730 [Thermoleophilia bacterium]|nr:hypothetical protein [Thermoleophilia bacterium]
MVSGIDESIRHFGGTAQALLDDAFISQVRGPYNPFGPAAASRNADCLVASSLMVAWLRGHGARPSTPGGIVDSIEAARLLATGKLEHGRGVTLAEGRDLLRQLGVDARVVHGINDVLDVVRDGRPAILTVRMDHAPRGPGTWSERSYHARSAALGIDHWPGDHAIAVGAWDSSSGTYGILDPMAVNGPFPATADELAYSNFLRAAGREMAGIVPE